MKLGGLSKMILLAGLIMIGLMVEQARPDMSERRQAETVFPMPSPIERTVLHKG